MQATVNPAFGEKTIQSKPFHNNNITRFLLLWGCSSKYKPLGFKGSKQLIPLPPEASFQLLKRIPTYWKSLL
jgi:hypothetical protein